MTEQHPITPPPELVMQIACECQSAQQMVTAAYRAGADQELEACCEWLEAYDYDEVGRQLAELLRAARRPKPPTLKEQALEALNSASYQPGSDFKQIDPARSAVIRRALEQLDD
jgi:hypothetical protein